MTNDLEKVFVVKLNISQCANMPQQTRNKNVSKFTEAKNFRQSSDPSGREQPQKRNRFPNSKKMHFITLY